MDIKHYEELSKVSTKGMTEKKNGLTYLTWSKAFDKLLEAFPEATYKIEKFEGKPYFMDDSGAMVFTEMTIEGITREMFLPVLDGANKPMKREAYKYTTRYGEKNCEAISMFDVNKALMRCLVKNMAVFGLGLNIYAGEDLPLGEEEKKSVEFEEVMGEDKICALCGTQMREGQWGLYCPAKNTKHPKEQGYAKMPVNKETKPF